MQSNIFNFEESLRSHSKLNIPLMNDGKKWLQDSLAILEKPRGNIQENIQK